MAKGRQLKGRIRSVQNTRKITRTMELVSTSKLKRAQDRVVAARPYADALREVIADLYTAELAERFPLLRRPAPPSKGGPSRAALILLTSNRGLAGGFHLSPGALIYNQNRVQADALIPGGQSFSLGGTTYRSDPANPVFGGGKIDFQSVAPTLTIGWGNLLPRSGRHFGVSFDIGAAYQGTPRATLNLAGSACDPTGVNCRAVATDPTIQSNIQSEQGKINNTISPFRFFPVVSLAFGYRF